MTNKDFYAFCRDQRQVESDPVRRDALTAVYNYMRECGVAKAGVADFLDYREWEAGKKRISADGYQWLRRVFASAAAPVPAQEGQGLLWTDADLDELAAITPADLAAASNLWEQTAPFKGLLGAKEE